MCERWGRYWRSNEGGTSLPRSVANIRCNEHRIPTLLCHDNSNLREFENEYLSMETEPDASLIASIIDPEIVSEIAELQLDTHGEFAIEEHRADRCMELALCAYNHSLLMAALRAGADPNSELSGQWGIVPTPLGFAINEQPPNFAAIRTLLAHKADIECRVFGDEDATGTYLHFAIFGGTDQGNGCGGCYNSYFSKALVVRHLLDARANPMTVADYFDDQRSPLSAAVSEGNVFIAAILLAAGATPTSQEEINMNAQFWPPLT